MLDRPLARLLHDGKIVVGQKLFVHGAELIGSEQAVSPLEVHVRRHEYVLPGGGEEGVEGSELLFFFCDNIHAQKKKKKKIVVKELRLSVV